MAVKLSKPGEYMGEKRATNGTLTFRYFKTYSVAVKWAGASAVFEPAKGGGWKAATRPNNIKPTHKKPAPYKYVLMIEDRKTGEWQRGKYFGTKLAATNAAKRAMARGDHVAVKALSEMAKTNPAPKRTATSALKEKRAAEFPYYVQMESGATWKTIAGFKAQIPAENHAVSIFKKFPDGPRLRVMKR